MVQHTFEGYSTASARVMCCHPYHPTDTYSAVFVWVTVTRMPIFNSLVRSLGVLVRFGSHSLTLHLSISFARHFSSLRCARTKRRTMHIIIMANNTARPCYIESIFMLFNHTRKCHATHSAHNCGRKIFRSIPACVCACSCSVFLHTRPLARSLIPRRGDTTSEREGAPRNGENFHTATERERKTLCTTHNQTV